MEERKSLKSGSLLIVYGQLYFNLRGPPRRADRPRRGLWEPRRRWTPGCPGVGRGPGSHPVPARAQRRAERPQGPVRPPRGQQERPRLGFMAGLPQVSGQRLRVPAPWLAGQQVLDHTRVEGCGDTRPQQLGVQEEGKEFSVAVRVIHLQERRRARRERGDAYRSPADAAHGRPLPAGSPGTAPRPVSA